MKHNWILLLLGCTLMACQKNSVDFAYTPIQPKAGEVVQFTNISTSGEEWEWSFGDGGSSQVKNPSKIYKQAGTYTVTLKVDNKARWTKTASITVYDTVPSFTCSVAGADTLGIDMFEDVTFTAQVYNPYNYTVEYEWNVLSNVLYTQLSGTNTESTYRLYFEQAGANAGGVQLTVTVNGVTHDTLRIFKVNEVKTSSLLMMTEDSTYYRQRIFGGRSELPFHISGDDAGIAIIDAAQDTAQTYNGKNFSLSELRQVFDNLLGFNIASRKIYFRMDEGLFVSNIDGSYTEPIYIGKVLAQSVDIVNNRLYWSTPDSVLYMPLIGSENNKFTTQPVTLNYIEDVVKLAIDPKKR